MIDRTSQERGALSDMVASAYADHEAPGDRAMFAHAAPSASHAAPWAFALAPSLGDDIIAYSTRSTVVVAPLTIQTNTQYKAGVPATRTDTVRDFTALLWATKDASIPIFSVNGVTGKPAYVTFSFPTTLPSYIVPNSDVTQAALDGYKQFSADEQSIVRTLLGQISAASGVVFLEVTGVGDMPFMHIDFSKRNPAAAGGFAAAPGNGSTSLGASDVYMDENPIRTVDVLLHEIGHAVGLQHPHDGTGTGANPYGHMLAADLDNVANTIMSYENKIGTGLGPLDIQALRFLYGDQLPTANTDYLWNAATQTLTQFGTTGADTLYGTGANDKIDGGDSNDTIIGKDGRNELTGGLGNDTITGGDGENIFTGGLGDDTLKGGGGVNKLYGNEGKDTIDGGTGSNDIDGGSEDDTISFIATAGKTFKVEGGTGADTLTIILGDSAPDTLTLVGTVTNVETINTTYFTGLPRTRAITINANDANGRLSGGDGNDVINGANGTFGLAGGKGDDTIISNGNKGTIAGEAGNDILRIGAAGGDMFGGSGRDMFYANTAAGYMAGGLRDDGGAIDGDVDTFVFAKAEYSVVGAVDSIGEFGAEDRIDLTGLNLDHYEIIANGDWSTIKGRQSDTMFELAVNARNLTTAQIIGDEGFSSNLNLVGTDAGETLTGGASDDTIEGRGGADRLTGGAGKDIFVYKDAAHSTIAAFDTITDFVRGTDRIDLTGLDLTSYTIATVGETSVITGIRNQNTSSETLFKLVVNTPGLTTADILGDDGFVADRIITGTAGDDNGATTRLLGGRGNDTIRGLGGQDLINGMEGDDVIEGGDGADHLIGGDGNGSGNPQNDPTFGNDIFLFTRSTDSIEGASDYIQDFVPGEDKIRFQGFTLTAYAITTVGNETIITGLEGATKFKLVVGRPGLTTADIEGDESFGTDVVKDGTPQRDVLTGGAGNDTINGKGGDDELRGAGGKDTLRGDEGLDTLYGDEGDDTLEGGTERDVLWGGADNDTLRGDAGDDQLSGDGGIDKLYGGGDNDTLIVKVSAVRTGFVVDGGTGIDNLTVNFDDTSKPQTLKLIDLGIVDVESVLVQGSGAADTLTANVTVSDKVTLNGWGGNDILTGGASKDALNGGTGDDTLRGGDADDVLNGEGGLDKLYGEAGNDTLYVSMESLPGGRTPNGFVIDGGTGNDLLQIYASDPSVAQVFTLGTGLVRTGIETINIAGGTRNDTLTADATSIVRLYGGDGDDTLQGGSGSGDLNGDNGNDIINGGSGSYRLGGGAGNDTITGQSNTGDLYGDAGNDTLRGGSGTGNLWGGTDDDRLIAGSGNSFMNGEAGRDTYAFEKASDSTRTATDTIGSFVSGTDTLDLSKIKFDGVLTVDPTTYTFGDGSTIAGTQVYGTSGGVEFFVNVYGVVAQTDVLLQSGQQLRKLADGYIAGATVYQDSNGNGRLDDGENFAFTDDFGNFELPADGTGPIRGFGGINIDTGLPNLLQLSAPGGATVVDPLTTLVQALVETGKTASAAAAQVKTMLGIDASIVLGTTDLLAEATGGDAAALEAQKRAAAIANIIVTGAAGVADGTQAAAAILAALADRIAQGGVAIDLTSSAALGDLYTAAGLGTAATAAAASAAAGNDAIQSATSLGDIAAAQKEGALTGNDLDNVLTGGTGADELLGFGGDDRLDGGAGDDVLRGGHGADNMTGGLGDDIYHVDDAGDQVTEVANDGADKVRAAIDYVLGNDIEQLQLVGNAAEGTGNEIANRIRGSQANQTLLGLGGDDILIGGDGGDILDGGAANDVLDGGAGRDTLTGGAGSDIFRFRSGDLGGGSAGADVITDFGIGGHDRIDLRRIDAIASTAAGDRFHFIDSGTFTGTAGELRFAAIDGDTFVQGDTNGDGIADLILRISGDHTLTIADFVGVTL